MSDSPREPMDTGAEADAPRNAEPQADTVDLRDRLAAIQRDAELETPVRESQFAFTRTAMTLSWLLGLVLLGTAGVIGVRYFAERPFPAARVMKIGAVPNDQPVPPIPIQPSVRATLNHEDLNLPEGVGGRERMALMRRWRDYGRAVQEAVNSAWETVAAREFDGKPLGALQLELKISATGEVLEVAVLGNSPGEKMETLAKQCVREIRLPAPQEGFLKKETLRAVLVFSKGIW